MLGKMSKKLSQAIEPDTTDFIPGLLAIQESPPTRLPLVIVYSLSAFFFVFLLWASFGKLDIVASAEGHLVPQTYTKIVQPADSGIVQDILVTEGQAVAAGQVLMRLDAKVVGADARSIESDLQLKALQLRRIDAELSGAGLSPLQRDSPALYEQIHSQYRAHRQAYMDELAGEEAVLERTRHELQSAQETLNKLQQVVSIYKKTAMSYEKLAQSGFVSEMAVQEKIRDRIEKEQDIRAQEATVASIQSAVNGSAKKLAQITSNYHSRLQNERVETEAQYQKLWQEFEKIQHRQHLLDLRASQAGIVKDLIVHTRGEVVAPGSVLMTLVPIDERLQAEVFVRNEDIGFVYLDQPAKIKLTAYPFQKYGMIEGKVIHIGADAMENPNSEARASDTLPPSYKVLIQLDSQFLSLDGERLKLSPGMRMLAEIHQGKRTVLEYLLSPVQKAFTEWGRER